MAPCEEGGPAGGAENSWSQVAVEEGTVQCVAPCEKGGPARSAKNSWSQVVGMRWLTYHLA